MWANNTRFIHTPRMGKGFFITGWDDGCVTFDYFENNYYGIIHAATGDKPGASMPGSAGIPPTAVHTAKKWAEKQMDNDVE